MKYTGFYSDSFSDYLKITILKKNAFNEFSFIENKEELENISKTVTDSFLSDLLLFPQNKIEMSKWCDKINIIGDFFLIPLIMFVEIFQGFQKKPDWYLFHYTIVYYY